MILDSLLPPSEQPSNSPPGIGPTEDDISLLWLVDSSQTGSAVQTLETTSPSTNNIAGIGEIFSGPGIAQMFNPPGAAALRRPAHAGYHRYPEYRGYLLWKQQEARRTRRLLAR